MRRGLVRFYVPQNFDAEKVLPEGLRRYADCANYLLHLIVRARVQWGEDEAGYVRLKVEYMRNIIPRHVEKPLRAELIGSGVLECDRQYLIGKKAMGYRLAQAYRVPTRRVECQCPRVAARIKAVRDPVFRTETRLPVHRHLRKWLGRIGIDTARAERTILDTPSLMANADMHLTAVAMIDDGTFDFTHCRMGRVHTNITRLARELRPCLHLDGKPLVNVDVRNCQPLILGLLWLQQNVRGEPEIDPRQFDKWVPDPYKSLIPLKPTSDNSYVITPDEMSIVISRGSSGLSVSPAPDVSRFLSLCESGRVYETLSHVAGLASLDRDAVKTKFYREVFFGRSQHVTDFTRLFGREFPTLMALIRRAKRHDYSLLACLMQNIEATLVIGHVCRFLLENHPDVPVVTIHDSIATTAPHVEFVASLMRGCFQRYGVSPSLKVEPPFAPEAKARVA